MKRIPTTVVTLVGDEAHAASEDLGRAANVRAVLPDPDDPPLERAVEAWRESSRSHRTFTVHDADPLALVRDAWVAHYDEETPGGALEVAVSETLARWRSGALELPDYYLVLEAEDLATTERHWYLGVLHEHAPHRVVPVAPDPDLLRNALSHLRAGRWWDDLSDLLSRIDRVVPDHVGVPKDPSDERRTDTRVGT
jgi:hypothetical protein